MVVAAEPAALDEVDAVREQSGLASNHPCGVDDRGYQNDLRSATELVWRWCLIPGILTWCT